MIMNIHRLCKAFNMLLIDRSDITLRWRFCMVYYILRGPKPIK